MIEERRSLEKDCEELDQAVRKASLLTLHTRSNCDAFLYFAQPFYEGWHTRIDEKETTVFRANYAFSAIFVKAGDHLIERFYKPESVKIGMVVSLFSVLLLFLTSRFLLNYIS